MKEKIDFAFVILTYRNTADIIECLDSLDGKGFGNYRVVIVDSYYNDETTDVLKNVARDYKAVFLSVNNNGYSAGNNYGISYCNQNYDYDYLVVCNPDIVVMDNKFDFNTIKNKKILLAPKIISKNGKMQNPYWKNRNVFFIWLIYLGYKYKNRIFLYGGIAGNKIIRELFNKKEHTLERIYAAHGCFVIFTKELIQALGKVYDENVFLFTEEAILAKIMSKANYPSYYTDLITIYHKEDGSMSVAKIDEKSELRKSFLYYYNTYELH